jgi:hypothetical protein
MILMPSITLILTLLQDIYDPNRENSTVCNNFSVIYHIFLDIKIHAL